MAPDAGRTSGGSSGPKSGPSSTWLALPLLLEDLEMAVGPGLQAHMATGPRGLLSLQTLGVWLL